MTECKCDMRTKLVGDGCMWCNPELNAQLMSESIDDLREENERLRTALQQIANRADGHPQCEGAF